jgi:hypothetical protein
LVAHSLGMQHRQTHPLIEPPESRGIPGNGGLAWLVANGTKLTSRNVRYPSAYEAIVLQKSKVAGSRIFRENTKREAIADSYRRNSVVEVTCEFNVRR